MELLTSLAAPLITGLVTLLGVVLANRKQQAIRDMKTELKEAELAERLDRMEGKIDSHNEYADLFRKTVAEQNVALARIDERLKTLEQRG